MIFDAIGVIFAACITEFLPGLWQLHPESKSIAANPMSNELKNTIRLCRPAQSIGESTIASAPPGTAEFELVSTQMLEKILFDLNGVPREKIRELAESEEEGWLAREANGDSFEIVKEKELEEALRSANDDISPPKTAEGSFGQMASLKETAHDLCLVSTQHLRRVFDDGTVEGSEVANETYEEPASFDPYNSS